VPLVAGLEYPGAGAGGDDVVAEERAKRPLEDIGVLVLARVPMERCRERARGEWVVDDGETFACFGAFDLPHDAESTDLDMLTSVRRNRDSVELRAHEVSFRVTVVFTEIRRYPAPRSVSTGG
jgi:hypothetical protein